MGSKLWLGSYCGRRREYGARSVERYKIVWNKLRSSMDQMRIDALIVKGMHSSAFLYSFHCSWKSPSIHEKSIIGDRSYQVHNTSYPTCQCNDGQLITDRHMMETPVSVVSSHERASLLVADPQYLVSYLPMPWRPAHYRPACEIDIDSRPGSSPRCRRVHEKECGWVRCDRSCKQKASGVETWNGMEMSAIEYSDMT